MRKAGWALVSARRAFDPALSTILHERPLLNNVAP